MITALVYIFIIIVIYMLLDVLIYVASANGPGSLITDLNALYGNEDPETARQTTTEILEKIKDWNDNERKTEYKCAYVATRFGKLLERLAEKWKDEWPEEEVEEITAIASEMSKATTTYFHTLARAILIAIMLALCIRTFVIQAFKIPSGSMIPTLYVGDQLLVTKFTYGIKIPYTDKKILDIRKPKHGDIVVFKPPKSVLSSWMDHEIRIPFTDIILYQWKSQVDFIKRIVGLPGDKVELKDGVLHINDKPMELKPSGRFEYEKANSSYVRNVHSWEFTEIINEKPHKVLYDSNSLDNEDWGPYYIGEGEFFAMGDNRDDSSDSRVWTSDAARIEDIRGKALIIHFSWDSIRGRPRFDRMGDILK